MDKKMKAEINAMLEDIMTVPVNEKNVRLYVILDGIRYEFRQETGDFMIQEQVLLYHITKPKDKPINEIDYCHVIDLNATNIKQPGQRDDLLQKDVKLVEILNNIPPAPDEEIFLITWDHGSVFGIFRENNPSLPKPIIKKPIDDHLDRYPYLALFWEKALGEEQCSKFLAQIKDESSEPIIQIRNSLFQISPRNENGEFFKSFLTNQKRLDLFYAKREEGEIMLVLKQNRSKNNNFQGAEASDIDYIQEKYDLNKTGEIGQVKINLEKKDVLEILKSRELSKAIEQWLINQVDKRVGVVLMMNCWMMNLHTMTALRTCAKYLVAPEGDIDTPGYNYKDILKKLNNMEGIFIRPRALSRKIIKYSHNKNFKKRAATLNKKNPQTIDERMMVAVDLGYFNDNGTLLGQFISLFNKILDTIDSMLSPPINLELVNLFKYLRIFTFDFSHLRCPLIDIPTFLKNLSTSSFSLPFVLFDADLRKDIDNLYILACNNNFVIKKFQGKFVFSNGGKLIVDQITASKPTGLSLFFPQEHVTDNNILDNISDDNLLINEIKTWKIILNKIYDNIIP